MRKDPVIIVGMHNSGTSLLTRIVAKAGVFVVQDMNHAESKMISMDLNDAIIMGKDWARDPIMPLSEVDTHWEAFSTYLDKHLEKYYEDAGYQEGRWGVKDPRICVLLPLYLRYFPEATIVHIHRQAEMVAVSIANEFKHGVGRKGDQALWRSLRDQHVERVRSIGESLGSRFYELSYEDLCTRPLEEAEKLFSALSLPLTGELEIFLKENVYLDKIDRSHLITASPDSLPDKGLQALQDTIGTLFGRMQTLQKKVKRYLGVKASK